MHTFHGDSCNIHYDQDMFGELHIIKEDTGEEIKVNAEDILKLVAEYIRSNKISKIECMEWQELLR